MQSNDCCKKLLSRSWERDGRDQRSQRPSEKRWYSAGVLKDGCQLPSAPCRKGLPGMRREEQVREPWQDKPETPIWKRSQIPKCAALSLNFSETLLLELLASRAGP